MAFGGFSFWHCAQRIPTFPRLPEPEARHDVLGKCRLQERKHIALAVAAVSTSTARDELDSVPSGNARSDPLTTDLGNRIRPGESIAAHIATIKAKIRHELPPHVFRRCPDRALTALVLGVAIAALTAVLLTARLPGFPSFVLSVVLGGLYGSLFFLGHEAGHGSVVRQRHLQDALMGIAFLVFLLPPTLWRVWHNKVHHVHTNLPDYDPDNFGRLAEYRRLRSIRVVAAFTPGSGRWISLLYLPTWFTVHTQLVLWVQSRRCRGFESLNRPRAAAESLVMGGFWVWLAMQLGPWSSLLVIVLPMMVANTIIMSYIVTNHLLRPVVDEPDPLATSMSVTTHPWMDLIHFNFSHHVEHHFFPAMSPRYAPLVRAKLRQYAGDSFLAPPHLRALRAVFRTPRIHDEHDVLVDPVSGRSIRFADLDSVLVAVTGARPRDPRGGEP